MSRDPQWSCGPSLGRVLIHQQIQGATFCYLYCTKAGNNPYLHNDPANALTAPLTPGMAGTISNSQCPVSRAASSVSATGNTLTLNLVISFTTGLAGTENVFGCTQDLGGLISAPEPRHENHVYAAAG